MDSKQKIQDLDNPLFDMREYPGPKKTKVRDRKVSH